jgi:uncharacterized protein YdeI (YjbR/CyaY-like superfamily)
MSSPIFFATPDAFCAWLAKHHASQQELWLGFYKKSSGKPSITWPESVDAALCFGWIDGRRNNVDEISYKIRFTPRKPQSKWSAVNVKRVAELEKLGLMQAAGRKAFALRTGPAGYSYEQRKSIQLDAAHEKQFRANKSAWNFFQAQPPGYRRLATFWVMSAKREETRVKRLSQLIELSAGQRRIPQLVRSRSTE